MRPAGGKDQAAITAEWDAIAAIRHAQIVSGEDVSYRNILVPCVLALLDTADRTAVLDVGCGSGVLTCALAPRSGRVLGIDVSSKAIDIAKGHCQSLANVRFEISAIEGFARAEERQDAFTSAVANMTLGTALNLTASLRGVAASIRSGGTFVATITHPWFWPHYWGYADQPWFNYRREIAIEAEFRISSGGTGLLTTHFHRPLEQYFAALAVSGLIVDTLLEPMPDESTGRLYPTPWAYPRFLAFRCHRGG